MEGVALEGVALDGVALEGLALHGVANFEYPFFPMYNTEKPHNNEELTYNNNRLNYYIDANGYLHFITEYAGDIIISDGPLVKK